MELYTIMKRLRISSWEDINNLAIITIVYFFIVVNLQI